MKHVKRRAFLVQHWIADADVQGKKVNCRKIYRFSNRKATQGFCKVLQRGRDEDAFFQATDAADQEEMFTKLSSPKNVKFLTWKENNS